MSEKNIEKCMYYANIYEYIEYILYIYIYIHTHIIMKYNQKIHTELKSVVVSEEGNYSTRKKEDAFILLYLFNLGCVPSCFSHV